MIEYNLILCFIIFLLCIFFAFSKKFNNSTKISIFLMGLFIIIIILVYPLTSDTQNELQRFVFSILYSIQCIYVGQDFEMVQMNVLLENYSYCYVLFLYGCFLSAPILTTSFILSILESFFVRLKYNLMLLLSVNKKVYIFSNLNNKSIMLAEGLDNKHPILVFCNSFSKENEELRDKAKKMKAMLLKDTELEFNVHKKEAFFYEIKDDEIENTNVGLKLIEKYKNNPKIHVVIFSTRTEAEELLDSVNRKVKVSLVNTNKYAMYDLFLRNPVIKYAKNNKISVLVIANEKKCINIVKMVLWSLQIQNYDLEINVVYPNASHIKSRLYHEAPGLKTKKYNINFYDADITTEEFDCALEKNCLDANYIILGLDDDELSIDTAIFLRRYFLRMDKENYSNKPAINIWLNKEIDGVDYLGINGKNYIKVGEENKVLYYEIFTFGTIEKVFKKLSSLNQQFEEFGVLCHLSNTNTLEASDEIKQKDINTYYNRQSTRDYSIAMSFHVKNVLYVYNINLYEEELTMEIVNKVYDLVKDEKIAYDIMFSATRFWNVYARCRGFNKVSFEEAYKFFKNGISTNHQHSMAQLNACLTDLDEFADHEKVYPKYFNREILLVAGEKKSVQLYPKMLEIFYQIQQEKKKKEK